MSTCDILSYLRLLDNITSGDTTIVGWRSGNYSES